MNIQLRKVDRVRIGEIGCDERWLQDQIELDPSLLGLGALKVFRRERSQGNAGRVDFVLFNPENNARFSVEVMLGRLDPDHIIRAIEYWDLERQRFPDFEHRAVIVAEEITGRFFNVIRLLNRAVPIIAVQLEAFRLDDSVVLHAVTVLNVATSSVDEPTEAESKESSRAAWEGYSSKASLAVADALLRILGSISTSQRVKYNQGHIAAGTTGYNFLWLGPVAKASHCNLELRVAPVEREQLIQDLDPAGILATPLGDEYLRIKVMPRDIETGEPNLRRLIEAAERSSRSRGEA